VPIRWRSYYLPCSHVKPACGGPYQDEPFTAWTSRYL